MAKPILESSSLALEFRKLRRDRGFETDGISSATHYWVIFQGSVDIQSEVLRAYNSSAGFVNGMHSL